MRSLLAYAEPLVLDLLLALLLLLAIPWFLIETIQLCLILIVLRPVRALRRLLSLMPHVARAAALRSSVTD